MKELLTCDMCLRHGLSYTTFETSNLKIDPISRKATLALTNTGPLPGAEVLQLYISAPNSPTERPLKELHGFSKVLLQPGEKKTVEIVIDPYAGSFWDEIEDCWRLEKGIYRIWVASSSQEGARGLGADWIVEKERLWKGL
jgi:beta-glucosidase